MSFFPDRPECWGHGSTNATCNVPTFPMFQFLNVTTPEAYFQLYCINPPDDSCSFGYCPNSDIAGPAVRIASESTTLSKFSSQSDEAQRTSVRSACPLSYYTPQKI